MRFCRLTAAIDQVGFLGVWARLEQFEAALSFFEGIGLF
jgi:hypothetical protein